MKRTVLFVHGFGVMKDARGMFTDIVSGLPEEYVCILVDLNTKTDDTIFLNPFSKQVGIITDVRRKYGSEVVDLICHSQGCIIAALANLPNIRKTIFLAPALNSSNEKTIEYFSKNPQTKIDINGVSLLARRDGTFTSVPSDYWKEKEDLDLDKVYNTYLENHDAYVVNASRDEVVSKDHNHISFDTSKVTELEADHDFREGSREKLVALVKDLLQ